MGSRATFLGPPWQAAVRRVGRYFWLKDPPPDLLKDLGFQLRPPAEDADARSP